MSPEASGDTGRRLAVRWTRRAAGLLMATGLIGFLGAFLCSMFGGRIPSGIRLPLGDVGSIAADSRGRIYCGSQGYSRVHQYDHDGSFLRSWWVDSGGGSFLLGVDAHDRIHVATARTNAHMVYRPDGHLISSERSGTEYDRMQRARRNPLRWRIPDGGVYEVKTPNLYPRVVAVNRAGVARTLVTTPFLVWMVAGPLPGWLRLAVAVVLLQATRGRGGRPGAEAGPATNERTTT